jgi:hypothetical protein
VKYVSNDSTHPVASANNGFWVRDDQIFDVTTSSHVRFVIENPSLFNLTSKQILEVYNKHGEVLGGESKAREELVRYATSLRWIRVRHYLKRKEVPDYWAINCHNTVVQREEIGAFIQWAIENEIMRPDDSAVILGFEIQTDRHVYSWSEGGISRYNSII